ncbi:MAG: class I SAM-dependent methyltransferase [Deltaproteobacteria bacterium]|nr:class I SAM-dependent methyltransferase [Deltaproteobacteria bacterium]
MKQLIKQIAHSLGFHISRLPKVDKKKLIQEYELVTPNAEYSPWNIDASFVETYNIIKPFTMVDQYRCFELWRLIEESSKWQCGSILEIGAWRGGTGALIAKRAKECGIAERVYLCDTFTGVVKAGPEDSRYKGGEHHDTSKQIVEELVFNRLNLDNVSILEGIFPDQTAKEIEDLKFRFCHIDVDVYQSAKDSVDWIWPRLVSGGIIVYDDYGFRNCDGITKYVEDQMLCKDRLVFHNLNGHAIVIKK